MVLSLEKLRRISENTPGILSTLLLAAGAAGASVAFLWLTNLLFRLTIVRLSTGPILVFVIGSQVVISLTSTATGLPMQKVSPKSAGRGVPELKAADGNLGFLQMRSVIVKFIGGVLTLGGGTSLGREGPSVFVGGGVASNLAPALGTPKTGRRQPASWVFGCAVFVINGHTGVFSLGYNDLSIALNNRLVWRVAGGSGRGEVRRHYCLLWVADAAESSLLGCFSGALGDFFLPG
jgi:hypothetical protein